MATKEHRTKETRGKSPRFIFFFFFFYYDFSITVQTALTGTGPRDVIRAVRKNANDISISTTQFLLGQACGQSRAANARTAAFVPRVPAPGYARFGVPPPFLSLSPPVNRELEAAATFISLLSRLMNLTFPLLP